jgi:AraC-like DNA-binding protein
MNNTYKISKSIVRSLLAFLQKSGFDAQLVCQSLDISHQDVMDGDDLLSAEIYLALLKAGEDLTQDPTFGLHFGKSAEPERWGVLGYIMTCCHTLAEAIDCQHRYQDLVGSLGTLTVIPQGDKLRLIWDTDFIPLIVHAEEAVTGWVTFGRWVTNTDITPYKIYFTHPAPKDIQPYQQFFNCPINFDAPFNGIEIDANLLNTPLKQPDENMKNWLIQHAEERLENIDEPQTFLKILTRYIKQTLPKKSPELGDAAAFLSISPRALQRKLEKKGLHFSGFIEQTRYELAIQYLKDPNNSMIDVAFLLGFSEQSAFNRAFKRRSGTTPGEFRRNKIYSTPKH